MLVVAVALTASAVVLVVVVGRTITETVSTAVHTRVDEVVAELAGGVDRLQLLGSDDGVLVQAWTAPPGRTG